MSETESIEPEVRQGMAQAVRVAVEELTEHSEPEVKGRGKS